MMAELRGAWERRGLTQDGLVHAVVVVVVILAATTYAFGTNDHSGNVWIVYGSAIGYAAGRSGATAAGVPLVRGRRDDMR